MLRAAMAIAGKDLKLILARSTGLYQALLMGLLLIFLFSLSAVPGTAIGPEAAATVFWLATLYTLVLVVNGLHALEESGGLRAGLLLAPCPAQAVWLGKLAACLALLGLAQLVFFPATVVFLGQDLGRFLELLPSALGVLLACDLGLACLGALLGGLAQGQAGRESLLSLILFPLLFPLLLAGVKTFATLYADPALARIPEAGNWLALALGFDAVFLGAALLLFPSAYSGED